MKTCVITLCLIIFRCIFLYSQQYTYTTSLGNVSGCSTIGVINESWVNYIVNVDGKGKPISISYQSKCYVFDDVSPCSYCTNCVSSSSIILPNQDCFSGTYSIGSCSQADLTISWQPILTIGGDAPGNYCGDQFISLTAISGLISYIWEYQVNGGAWMTLTGLTANSVTFNLSAYFGATYLNYLDQNLNFRYRTSSCVGLASNAVGPYVFYPPAPTITSAIGNPPNCPGGEGSISITHGSNTALGSDFVYTVTQYKVSASNCVNSNETLTLPQTPCANCWPHDISTGSKTYCTGVKGVFKKQFSTAGELSYTLTSNQNLDGGGYLSLIPGIYQVKIEAADYASCFAVYYIEIPDAPPTPVIDDPVVIRPSCSGGNDGSAIFTINKRGKYNIESDIQYTLKKNGTVYVKDGLPYENLLVNLDGNNKFTIDGLVAESNPNYELTVLDVCSSDPIKQKFGVDEGDPFSITNILFTDPTCVTNSGGNGSIIATATSVTGKTYTFELYTFGDTNNPIQIISGSVNSPNQGTFSNLPPYDYFVKISTNNNCLASYPIGPSYIKLNPPGNLSASDATTTTQCVNSTDGSITINVSKQNGSFDYSLSLIKASDASFNISASNILTSSYTIGDLGQGTYNMSITDQCAPSPGNTISVNNIAVTGPSAIFISNPGNQALACFDGLTNANITVQGGGFSDYVLDVKNNNNSLQGYPRSAQPLGQFDLNSIGVGSYQVVATEKCTIAGVPKSTATMNFSITSNATSPITTTITKLKYNNGKDLSCAGANNGRIEVAVLGGVPGTNPRYIVEVLKGQTPVGTITNVVDVGSTVIYTISGLAESTNYNVRVTDNNSCVKAFYPDINGNYLLLDAPLPLTISNSSFSNLGTFGGELYSICKGDANGAYTAQISGGNSTYKGELFKSSVANNFPATAFQTVTGSTGQAIFAGLGVGYYQLLVTDQQGCTTSQQFEIKETDASVTVTDISVFEYTNGLNTSCYGGGDGSITVTASGGVGKYTYILWSDGTQTDIITKQGTPHTFSGLPAINPDGATIKYTIGLKDELGCAWQGGNPVSQFKELTFPQQLKFYRSLQSNTVTGYEIPCKGDNAIVRFESEGGWLPHYVTINGTTKSITSDSPYVEFILPAGNYTADFKDVLNCTASSQSFNLQEPSSHIAINIGTIIPPACIGGSDGQVNVSASGGVTGGAGQEYTFQLRDAGANNYNNDSQTGNNKTFLRPANDYLSKDYDAIAVDAYGCTSEASFTMPVNPTPLTLTTNELVSPSCYGDNNGYITLQSANQTYINGNQLKFKITGGHYGNTIQEVLVASDTYTFTNLEATDMPGYVAYKAWVEDANACVMEAYQYQSPLELPSYEPLQLNLLQSIRPSCFNGSDGSLYIQVTGGVPAYQYSRDNITFYPISTDKIFTNQLTAGQYTYYLKDSNYDPTQPKCLNTTQFVVPVGRALRQETAITNISCKGGNDGSIDLTVNLDNRNANENFDLNRLSLAWVNNAVSSIPFNTAEDVYTLTRGTYTVKALYDVDSLVCSQQKTVNVLEPSSAFRITEVKTYQASCGGYSDGKAVVTWAGGWPNSVSHYKVDNSAWQSMSASSFVLTGLAPGSHQVEIAQKNFSCTDIKNFEITTASLALTVSNIIKSSCPLQSDGAIVLSSLSSGVEYAFENGTFQQLPSFTGLAAGTYQLTARKSNDPTCVSGTVEATITDPLDCGNGPLTLTLLSTSVATCSASADGSAQVLAGGGVPPFRFYWDGSNTEGTTLMTKLAVGSHSVTAKDAMNVIQTLTFEISACDLLSVEEFSSLASCVTTCDGVVQLVVTGGSGQHVISWSDGATGATRNNLCVGNYSYTITDGADNNNKCFLTGDVTIDHYPSLVLSQQNAVAPTCPGGTNGYVSVAVEGGSGQYQLQWAINNNVVSNETKLSGVAPGTFSLTATDKALGCSMSQDFTIPDAPPISVTSTDITPPSCNGGTDGRIALTLSNAPSPLVQWSNGQLGLKTTGLKAGTYQYTITSTAGCSITGSVVVTDRQQLQVSTSTVVPTCFGLCDGEAALNITGGTTPYDITWAHGPNTLTAKNLCAGTYAYTVSDKFNCSIKSSVVVATPDPVTIALVSKQDASCNGVRDGKLEVTATGGTGALSYLWNTGITTSTLNDVGAGDYKVSVSDVNACIARKTISITEPALLLVKDEVLTNPSCPASTDGKISLSGTGGTTPYQYQWMDQIVGSSRSGLSAGDYALNVTDSKGCSISKKYTLRAPLPVEIVNVTKKDPSCFGYQDGQITFEAVGGKGPYGFSWTNGSTNSSASTLVAGNYSVTIKDVNNCTVTGSYTLIDPIAPVITGIAANTVICTGSTLVVQPNGTWSRYEWKSPEGKLYTTPKYETNILGTHKLTAWDQRNCPAETSFVIEVSDNALKADFLRLSEAVVYKPVVFVDISTPVPTKIEWVIPGDVVVNRKTNEMVEVVFTNPGLYDIGIRGSLDRCQSELFKTVEVKEEKDNKGGRVASSDEEKVDVFIYPNPASNEMSIQVSSYSRSEIVLRLLTSLENRQVAYERLDGQLDYLVRWDVGSLTPGVFFLVYEQDGKIYSKRVLVVR